VQENVALCHVDNSVDERKGKKKLGFDPLSVEWMNVQKKISQLGTDIMLGQG
jgi:hypothetical protein